MDVVISRTLADWLAHPHDEVGRGQRRRIGRCGAGNRRAGQYPTAPARDKGGDRTYVATVTPRTADAANTIYVRDSEAILKGLQVLQAG